MRSGRGCLTILVLDNDVAHLETFEDLLVQDGHSVFPTTLGSEAVRIALREPIDLSFLDFDLPDLDGIETFTRIRKERPRLPGIFISGNPSEFLETWVLEAGGFALLRKPLSPPQVRSIVLEVMERFIPGSS